MKIAITVTKGGKDADACNNAWINAFKKMGDDYRLCLSIEQVKTYSPDLILMNSYPSIIKKRISDEWDSISSQKDVYIENGKVNNFRLDSINYCRTNNIRLLIIDSPIFKGHRDRTGSKDSFFCIGYDGIKRLGFYYEDGNKYLSNRWKRLGLKWHLWQTNFSNNYLIFCQPRFGAASSHIDINEWYRKTFKHIINIGGRILVSPHPQRPEGFSHPKIKSRTVLAEERYNNIRAAISFSSNAAIDAILHGVPTIIQSRVGFGYDYCDNSIDKLENPKEFNRLNMWNKLAACQWSIEEIENGDCWEHLRQYALDGYQGV